jgi:glutaredoxin
MVHSSLADWVVYTREGCSLCEEFQRGLATLLGAQAHLVRVIDIAADAELEARYGRKIPVLAIDDEIVCMYRLDPERVRAHLD